MYKSNTVVNQISKRSCEISGGHPQDIGVVYSAECTKHHLLYVGQTGDSLSNRFNGHRSDIRCYPDRCDLPKHFHENGCSFINDLQVSVLEKVKGSAPLRKYKEDKWMTRLNTIHPYGMNQHVSEFGSIYKALFF